MRFKLLILFVIICSILIGCSTIERKMLFYPTHRPHDNSLIPWFKSGDVIGYCRAVKSPKNIWLMLHGNGGQASDRIYAIPSFSDMDSVYILEYPGYGSRKGTPSKDSFNQAAQEAYEYLKEAYPSLPVCIAAESIGSGPASTLSNLIQPPDKLVLIVPFDKLSLVAKDHFPSFLVNLFLRDDWDNVKELSSYKGRVEIIGAESDEIISVKHARSLAAAIPRAKLTIISGGHNDWSFPGRVKIMN